MTETAPQPTAKPTRKVQALLIVGVLVNVINTVLAQANALHLNAQVVGYGSIVVAALGAWLVQERA